PCLAGASGAASSKNSNSIVSVSRPLDSRMSGALQAFTFQAFTFQAFKDNAEMTASDGRRSAASAAAPIGRLAATVIARPREWRSQSFNRQETLSTGYGKEKSPSGSR